MSEIVYVTTLDSVTAEHLRGGFFEGWQHPPTPQTHLRLLHGSTHVVLAKDGDAVIGYITAITDGVLAAYIPHLEVLPAYQARGIGTALVTHMFEQLRAIYMIDLICDDDLQPFYERLGMMRYTGMIKRNYERQSGE